MEEKVCEKFCKFYKSGRSESEKCGSYEFLRKNLTTQELASAASKAPKKADLSSDDTMREMVCADCGFRLDGCDFRIGEDSPPCGGYNVVSHLLKKNYINA